MPSSIRLRPLIICTFVLLVVGIGASISLLVYERSAKLLHREAMLSAKNATQATSRELLYNLRPTQRAVRILAHLSEVGSGDLQQWLTILPVMVEALQVSPTAHAFYFANQQGNMFMVRRLVAGVDKAAPPATRFVVLAIERIGSQAQAVRLYFDGQLRELSRHVDEHARGFDPRQRPWFTLAMSSPSLVRTDPYAFYTSGEVGTTLALATPNGQGVVAADVSHYLLAQMLRSYRSTPSSRLLLFDQAGRVLAAGDRQILDQSVGMQPLGQSLNPILKAMAHAPLQSGGEQVRDAEQRTWFVQRLQVSMTKVPLFLGIAVPEDELLDDARQLRNSVLRDSVLILLLALPLVVWLSGRLARPISELTQRAESLRHFDFSEPQQAPQTGSKITEVRQLGQTLDSSRSSLQRFIEIIARLSGESDTERLLPTLLQSTCEACAAHGALLYIRQDQHSPLYLAAGRWGTRELALVDAPVLFAVEQALAEQRSVFEAADSVACGLLDLPATASLSVPLFSRQHSGVGVLVLFHQQPPASSQVRFIEALSGFAAMALETLGLIDKQKALFEAFIQLIASAIDAKSPYTGGHCSRVPEATKLLAEAVCAETQGPYADFRMDQADWQALHIGAWLHDCGKVTTPEYVVDKATKLETLYDRIHEVRTRFEVLKRDAQISYLQALQESGADEAALRAERDALLQCLDEEFAFVAACNTGAEFMGDEQLQRLQDIAGRTWLRTLDDRLGISGDERQRKEAQPVVPLPALEPLLADRPEQRIQRRASECYAADNPWGFRMPIPELLYDRGELKNLSIRRGTLTEEERYKINEHIVQTIIMLSALPFPPELAQIPEIAGGHHERIDGKGYPCGLTGEQLSPQARMMAIADVFEALTARDRPYKPSKTLSQALRIMRSMAEGGHLDRELLRIFIRSGACLRYAERYLEADQLDVREVSEFLPQ